MKKIILLSCNNNTIKYICNELINFNIETIVYTSKKQFFKNANKLNCMCFIIDLLTSQQEFQELNNSFFSHILSDALIVLGNKEENGVSIENFSNIFASHLALHLLSEGDINIYSGEQLKNLENKIEQILIKSGFNPSYKGFNFVVDIMSIYLTTNKRKLTLYKDIFPIISRKCNYSVATIDRDVRWCLYHNRNYIETKANGKFSNKLILELIYREIIDNPYIKNCICNKYTTCNH